MRLKDLKKNVKEVRKQAMEIMARKAIRTGGPASVTFLKKDVKWGQCDWRRGSQGKRRQREEQRRNENVGRRTLKDTSFYLE